MRLSNLGDGIGQLSALTLAELTCASGRKLPLVIKLQAPVAEMHQVALHYGHYETEVNFYREMAAEIPLRTPQIYVCAMDPASGRVLIIMEAFGDWHSPDQLTGADAEQVATAIEELAALASAYWESAPTIQFPWLKSAGSPQYATLPEDHAACLPILLDRFENSWPAGSAAKLKEISSNYARVQQAIIEGTQVLSHWDFRVENLFFGSDGELAVIDWQLMHTDNPANDLAYLLATNVDVELRRKIEADMMALYLRELRDRGIDGYGMANLVSDYRLALLSITAILVIGGANADIGNQRSRALFATMGERLLAAIEDWQAVDILRSL
jgi:aminoglycoside/choline kinase family phosphotransferase